MAAVWLFNMHGYCCVIMTRQKKQRYHDWKSVTLEIGCAAHDVI